MAVDLMVTFPSFFTNTFWRFQGFQHGSQPFLKEVKLKVCLVETESESGCWD